MLRPFALLLAFAASLALAAPAQAQANEPNVITVTGEASVEVQPDAATITFSIESEERDAAAAIRDNEERAARVLGAIRALGVPDRDISVYVLSSPTDNGRVGVRRLVAVRTDITRIAPDLAFAAAEAGSTTVPSVTFVLRDATRERAETEAMTAAAAAARAKADALAAALGVRLGPPVSVSDRSDRFTLRGISSMDTDATAAAYSVGNLTVKGEVFTRFLILDPEP